MVTNKGKIWMCRVWPHTWLCHEAGYEPGVDWHGSPIYLQAWQEVLPTNAPSIASSDAPSLFPSYKPSLSIAPTIASTTSPSFMPSTSPSYVPSESLSGKPSLSPSDQPSVSLSPSTVPSDKPSLSPSDQPSVSVSPSTVPSASPSDKPSLSPSESSSESPSSSSSSEPSISVSPSTVPSASPSQKPSTSFMPSISLAPTIPATNAPFALLCPQVTGATQLGQQLEGVGYNDRFGRVKLSADGTTLAVQGTNYPDYTGRVQVYRRKNGIWVQIGQTFEGEEDDNLGNSMSFSTDGSKLAISTAQTHNRLKERSYAKVYEYNAAADSWVQIGNTITHYRNCLDYFGITNSLSADGTILAVGAPSYSDSWCKTSNGQGGAKMGLVKVYQYTTSTGWTQLGNTLYGEESDPGDFFGAVSLSADGTILAVGAPDNDANGVDAGHARVFQYDGANWVQNGADIDGANAGDKFGTNVALSSDGKKVAVIAPWTDGPQADRIDAGRIQVYESSDSWTTYSQVGGNMDAYNPDPSIDVGSSHSLSGDGTTVALGASAALAKDGQLTVWKDDGAGNWDKRFQFQGDNDEMFGTTSSLSNDGNIVAIGAMFYKVGSTSFAGRVCVYELSY